MEIYGKCFKMNFQNASVTCVDKITAIQKCDFNLNLLEFGCQFSKIEFEICLIWSIEFSLNWIPNSPENIQNFEIYLKIKS